MSLGPADEFDMNEFVNLDGDESAAAAEWELVPRVSTSARTLDDWFAPPPPAAEVSKDLAGHASPLQSPPPPSPSPPTYADIDPVLAFKRDEDGWLWLADTTHLLEGDTGDEQLLLMAEEDEQQDGWYAEMFSVGHDAWEEEEEDSDMDEEMRDGSPTPSPPQEGEDSGDDGMLDAGARSPWRADKPEFPLTDPHGYRHREGGRGGKWRPPPSTPPP